MAYPYREVIVSQILTQGAILDSIIFATCAWCGSGSLKFKVMVLPVGNRLDPWPRCRHSREGGNPVYFGLHAYKKSVWIPAFAGMTVAGSKRLLPVVIADNVE